MSKNLSEIFPPTEIGGGGGGGIEEAPKTGKMYARKDAAWEEFATGNLDDGNKDGEILTWDTATANWTHDDALIVKGGNVGIGTDSPNNLLVLSDGGNDGVEFGVNNATYGNFMLSYKRTSGTNGYTPMAYRASAHNWFLSGTNQGMALTGSGNLGIGTDSPSAVGSKATLHVSNATNGGAVRIGDASTNMFIDCDTAGGTRVRANAGEMVVGTNAAQPLNLMTGANTRLTIDASGDATFSSTVNAEKLRADNVWGSTTTTGIRFATSAVVPTINGSTGSSNNSVNLGIAANSWKDGWFGGTVNAGSAYIKQGSVGNRGGAQFGSANGFLQLNNTFTHFEPSTDAVVDLGSTATRFKNAHFAGTLNATTIKGTVTDVPDHVKAITPTDIANWNAGGGSGSAVTDGRISDTQIVHWDQAYSWGNHADANYQPAGNYATAGTSYTKAESDAKYELKGAGGLPAGDWHCTGNITCEGNITAYAPSDERLKDDIAPMPLGLIDGIAPATWKWKESGKASGGVIAQQLQKAGLDDWVNESPNGDLGVDYNALIGVLLAEVQELKARVRELEG